MKFEFATSQRIIFGAGAIHNLGGLAGKLGGRVLLVHGSGRSPLEKARESLAGANLEICEYALASEPDIDSVTDCLAIAREHNCEVVVGFGGGSVLDCAKAVSALMTNPGSILDYLEVVGKGQPITIQPLPTIAIPTTSGTGSEVTLNAVIAVPEQRVKVSLRSPMLLPTIALVDPELTWTTPPSVTAGSGLDALTQNIEAYTTLQHNPLTDSLAREGIGRAARSLRNAFFNGLDAEAREDMAIASLFGGLALANSGLGAVHGFAGVLGGMTNAPHGPICGRLLPGVVRANVDALLQSDAQSHYLKRYLEIARLLCQNTEAQIYDGIAWLEETVQLFGIERLGAYGLQEADLDEVVRKSQAASSMKKNPVVLESRALRDILLAAL